MVNRRFFSAGSVLALLLLAGPTLVAQTGTSSERKSPTTSFDVDGIHVIMTPADNQIISVIVGLDGGMADGTTDNPAIAGITADVVTSSGSIATSKKSLREFLTRTSTRLDGSADRMGVQFTMTATKARFMEAWGLLAGIIRAPLFDAIEFRNVQQRRIASVKSAFSNPENQAARVADSLIKHRHPWLGRYSYEEDVAGVTIEKMQAFYESLQQKSRMLLVIVGNVTEKDVRQMLSSFSSWPQGSYVRPKIDPIPEATAPVLETVAREEIPTNYVYAMFPGPSANDEGAWPMTIGLSYLRDILFREIRTKRNLSYAPFAYLSQSYGHGVGVLGVSSIDPDSSISVIYRELEKMKDGDFPENELENAKQVFTTRYYMREMTNASKASRLFYNERYSGDWRKAFAYDDISSVTKADVVKAFREYTRNLQVGVVGNPAQVSTQRYIFKDAPPNR